MPSLSPVPCGVGRVDIIPTYEFSNLTFMETHSIYGSLSLCMVDIHIGFPDIWRTAVAFYCLLPVLQISGMIRKEIVC